MNRFDKLVTNNTQYSSKSFVLVLAAMLVCVIVIGFMGLLYIDMLNPNLKIESNMTEMAAIVTAIVAALGYLYYSKVKSEKQNCNGNNSTV